MNTALTGPKDETCISLDASLPLICSFHQNPSLNWPEEVLQGNISLLKALSAIEAAHERDQDIPESTRKALERIESKLDVLMLLVAKMASENSVPPTMRHVSLCRDHISWHETGNATPAIGSSVCIKVFLSPRIPQPLILHGNTSSTKPLDSGFLIRVNFEITDNEMLDWLDRTIFRYHRRAVHAIRHS